MRTARFAAPAPRLQSLGSVTARCRGTLSVWMEYAISCGTKCKRVAVVIELTAAPFGLGRAGLERLTPDAGTYIVGRYMFHGHGGPFDMMG